MKAVVCLEYGDPTVLELKEVTKPIPKKNEVCIKIINTSVTSSDCKIRGFQVSKNLSLPMKFVVGFKKPKKQILGMVFAGIVDSVGTKVKKFKKGDRVFGFDRYNFGTYAEYKCMLENGIITKIADNISYQEAVTIPFGGMIALHYLRKGKINSKQKVLIYGASGAIGSSAVQLAKYFGANVTGVCSTTNLKMIKSIGADYVIDYTKENLVNRDEKYDLILNAVGRKQDLEYEQMLTKCGKYVSVDSGSPKLHIKDLYFLNTLVKKGIIVSVIDQYFSLEEIVKAHFYVDKGHKKGNVVINVT